MSQSTYVDQTFYIKENDTSPPLDATLQDARGGVVNIAGASVQFHMKHPTTGAVEVNAAATILSAAGGLVRHVWLAAHTDTPGEYQAEFEVTFADGKIETFPNNGYIKVVVLEELET